MLTSMFTYVLLLIQTLEETKCYLPFAESISAASCVESALDFFLMDFFQWAISDMFLTSPPLFRIIFFYYYYLRAIFLRFGESYS